MTYLRTLSTVLGTSPDQPRTLSFSRLTAIVGPTRSGKSAIHQSIRTALSWPRPTRANARAAQTLTELLHPSLSAGTIGLAFAEDGSTEARQLNVTWERGKVPIWTASGGLDLQNEAWFTQPLVLDRVRDFWALTAKERLARWTARYADAIDLAQTGTLGGAETIKEWQTAVGQVRTNAALTNPVDQLQELISRFSAAMLRTTAERKEVEASINALGAVRTTPTGLGDIEEQLALARAWESGAALRDQAARARAALRELQAQAADIAQSELIAQESVSLRQDQRAALEEPRARLLQALAVVQGQLQANATLQKLATDSLALAQANPGAVSASGAAHCFACSRVGADYEGMLLNLKNRWEQRHAEQAALLKQQQELNRAITQADKALTEAQRAYDELKHQNARRQIEQEAQQRLMQRALEQLQASGGAQPYDGPSSIELEQRRVAAEAGKQQLIKRNALDSQLRELNRRWEMWRALKAHAQVQLRSAGDLIKTSLQADLGALLPPGLSVTVDLEEGGSPLRLLTADGQPYSADRASGYERLALTLADAQTLADSAPWSLLLLDTSDILEAGEHAPELLGMLAQAVRDRSLSQVIVTAHDLRPWGSATPDALRASGWTLVQLPQNAR